MNEDVLVYSDIENASVTLDKIVKEKKNEKDIKLKSHNIQTLQKWGKRHGSKGVEFMQCIRERTFRKSGLVSDSLLVVSTDPFSDQTHSLLFPHHRIHLINTENLGEPPSPGPP